MSRLAINILLMGGLTLVLPACSAANAPPPAATQPAQQSTGGTYTGPGISLTWPDGWKRQDSKDYVLFLHPAADSTAQNIWLSLDIPDLPPHIPGLIPIGSVRNGYLDDLKKQFGAVKTQDLSSPNIPDAKIRFVRSTWHPHNGPDMQETALLLVHKDHVYILRARSDIPHESSTRPAFDVMVKSLKWNSTK